MKPKKDSQQKGKAGCFMLRTYMARIKGKLAIVDECVLIKGKKEKVICREVTRLRP